MQIEVADMKADESSVVFRSLRSDDCETFLSLADGCLGIVGDLGRSLLHEAIAHGKGDAAYALLERGAQVDARDDLGRTPLHYAAMFGQTGIATRLIEMGADPNAKDIHGNNPLWAAILNPKIDLEFIRILVRNGSSKTSLNKAGKSAISMAEAIGDEAMLKSLENDG